MIMHAKNNNFQNIYMRIRKLIYPLHIHAHVYSIKCLMNELCPRATYVDLDITYLGYKLHVNYVFQLHKNHESSGIIFHDK